MPVGGVRPGCSPSGATAPTLLLASVPVWRPWPCGGRGRTTRPIRQRAGPPRPPMPPAPDTERGLPGAAGVTPEPVPRPLRRLTVGRRAVPVPGSGSPSSGRSVTGNAYCIASPRVRAARPATVAGLPRWRDKPPPLPEGRQGVCHRAYADRAAPRTATAARGRGAGHDGIRSGVVYAGARTAPWATTRWGSRREQGGTVADEYR